MKILFLLLLMSLQAFGQFTDFYVDTAVGSSNIYSGSTASTTPTYISLSGNWNGSTTFTPTDGSTPASTVSAGMWAAISFTSVPSNAVYIAVVDTVNAGANGTIVLSANSKAGTAPGSITGDATLVVGGVWKGPNTNNTWAGTSRTIVFPFGFAAPTMTNESSANVPRINFKTGRYDTTNSIIHSINGPVMWQAYNSTVGDTGLATINGGLVYPGYILFSLSGTINTMSGFIFEQNGTTSGPNLVNATGTGGRFYRCKFRDCRANGLNMNAAGGFIWECEGYYCNKNNTASQSPFQLNNVVAVRCLAYSNTTANSSGFIASSTGALIACISAYNGKNGFVLAPTSGQGISATYCDSYANAGHGLDISQTSIGSSIQIENCNFIQNTAAGITNSSNIPHVGFIVNCGFGSGTSTNSGGNTYSIPGMIESGDVLYPANSTPWSSPSTLNFNVSLSQAKAAGRGTFLQSTGSTVAYPDIGAAQSASTNATGGSYTFQQ